MSEATLYPNLVCDTVVDGIGTTNQSIQRGNAVELRIGPAEGGGLGVTLDFARGTEAVATFSFVQR